LSATFSRVCSDHGFFFSRSVPTNVQYDWCWQRSVLEVSVLVQKINRRCDDPSSTKHISQTLIRSSSHGQGSVVYTCCTWYVMGNRWVRITFRFVQMQPTSNLWKAIQKAAFIIHGHPYHPRTVCAHPPQNTHTKSASSQHQAYFKALQKAFLQTLCTATR
jgi:hypothetical protein